MKLQNTDSGSKILEPSREFMVGCSPIHVHVALSVKCLKHSRTSCKWTPVETSLIAMQGENCID